MDRWPSRRHAISEMDFQCIISRALLPIGVAICVRDFASDFVVKNEASARPLLSPLFSPQVLRMIRELGGNACDDTERAGSPS